MMYQNEMIAIIFGANGQDGFYLSQILKSEGVQVITTSRSSGTKRGDISDKHFVESLVKKYNPEYIFHLAAESSTAHAHLEANFLAISRGSLNILEACKNDAPTCKIFLSGSAMQFKNEGTPISEETPFEASSPYSIARIHSTYAARYYRDKFNLNVYVGYLFNHDSPMRTVRHVNKYISETAKQIASGKDIKLKIGDPLVRKEFNFAGDTVDAIWILVNQAKVFEAIIGSGEAHPIETFIDECFSNVGLDYKDHLEVTTGFKSEYNVLVSKPSLIKSLGWQPKTTIRELAQLMVTQ